LAVASGNSQRQQRNPVNPVDPVYKKNINESIHYRQATRSTGSWKWFKGGNFPGADSLEALSKPQVRFKGKAQADEKAQHTWWYVSILKRLATQPLGLRWGFETASR
jgi:hypothetical protein